MQCIDKPDQLFDLLQQGAIAITPNNRLSTHLQESYFKARQRAACLKPAILPWNQFLNFAYDQWLYDEPDGLLSPLQTRLLWEKILREQTDIVFSEGLLEQVIKGWEICQQWGQDPSQIWQEAPKQCLQFQQWCQAFDQACRALGFITLTSIPARIAESVSRHPLPPLIWLCFDEFSPQQQNLQQALLAASIPQYRYELSQGDCQRFQYQARDATDEYQAMFAWLNARLAQGDRAIGVIIPDLTANHAAIARLCATHLPANSYSLSLGQSLADQPMIAQACQLLALEPSLFSHAQIELLLYSPWIQGGQQELLARSQCRQDNPQLARPSISLDRFCQQISQAAPVLHRLVKLIKPLPAIATPAAWVQVFLQRLADLGFPGDAVLDSSQYQLYQDLLQIFEDFRNQSLLYAQLSRDEALTLLNTLTRNRLFQIQTPRYPIQFSGLLEAAGCRFDSLWIAGMTDLCLPQKVKLHPLIPKALQRQLNMPHANPARERHFAQQQIDRLCAGSPLVIASYPHLLEDKPQLPSPLIADWPVHSNLIGNKMVEAMPLEEVPDSYQYPIRPDQPVRGGTSLLANQAKCPFRAFAQHRLNAKAEPDLQEGIDPRDRGNLIHQILEQFWRKLGSQAQLMALSPEDCQQLMDELIQNCLQKATATLPFLADPLLQSIEAERMRRLLNSYLEWERQRAPFVIAELEQAHELRLGRLELQLRLDRLDQLPDGRKWIIDYKSNLPVTKPWLEERPQEPQLLLYALLDEAIRALHYIQLKSGQPGYASFSEEKLPFSGNQSLKAGEDWDSYREKWQLQLQQLADEYLAGHCPPQPNKPAVCGQCDFGSLCRFNFT